MLDGDRARKALFLVYGEARPPPPHDARRTSNALGSTWSSVPSVINAMTCLCSLCYLLRVTSRVYRQLPSLVPKIPIMLHLVIMQENDTFQFLHFQTKKIIRFLSVLTFPLPLHHYHQCLPEDVHANELKK